MNSDDLPLSRASIDRAAVARDGASLERALADAGTRVLLVSEGAVLTDDAGDLVLVPPLVARGLGAAGSSSGGVLGEGRPEPDWFHLGTDGATTYLARRVDAAELATWTEPTAGRAPAIPGTWASLRVAGAHLSAADAGLATTAVALDTWHARHTHCPRCGAPTRLAQSGWVRVCERDGTDHYPRTDPAVIMAVLDPDDRLLLGHAAPWAPGRWSTLAGFVEAGESLENAVRREVLEEVDVVVGPVEYRGSQPWPFPASLMVGFVARATTTELHVDGAEVTEARWFTRDELAAAVAARVVLPPGRTSIARALIEEWFGAPLPEPAPGPPGESQPHGTPQPPGDVQPQGEVHPHSDARLPGDVQPQTVEPVRADGPAVPAG